MKFLSKTRIYSTLLENYIDLFLGKENANLVTLLNYRKTEEGYELYFEYPNMTTLNDYLL